VNGGIAGSGTIVVGVDGSESSSRALAWAAGLGRALGAEVVVVHALGLIHRRPNGDTVASDTHRGEIRAELDELWCAPVRDADVPYRTELREGNPVTVLLETADASDASLIVVGSRGLGGFPGLQLGSTSAQVVQHARRPVVVVPDVPDIPGAAE
jgi:nucleotide-binding universal stress UspA family protein